jgi:hypothetical protein
MKILLDESVPQKLRLLIEGGHTVVTVVSALVRIEERRAIERGGRSRLRIVLYSRSGSGLPAEPDEPKNCGAGAQYE